MPPSIVPIAMNGPLDSSPANIMQEISTTTQFPRSVLIELEKRGLDVENSTLCEILPTTRVYKGVSAYCGKMWDVGILGVDKTAEEKGGGDEDEEDYDVLGEWEENSKDEEEDNKDEEEEMNIDVEAPKPTGGDKEVEGDCSVNDKGEKVGSEQVAGAENVEESKKESAGEGNISAAGENTSREETGGWRRRKVAPAPRVKLVLGLGVFSREEDGRKLHVCHYTRGIPMGIKPIAFRAICVAVEGKDKEARSFVRKFLQKCVDWRRRSMVPKSKPGKYVLYRYRLEHGCGWWQNDGMKRSRPLSTVILQKGLKDSVVQDLENFLLRDTKKWYIDHGLPHRRSYLFYGPPGTGKTSMIRALAGKFELTACFLSMANRDFKNENLADALHECPSNAILVIEDVDCLFGEDRSAPKGVELTFSGLLNALDGMVSGEGRLTIMTTNHMEKLDTALIRSGRVDRRFEFGSPGKSELGDLYKNFYPGASASLTRQFVNSVWDRKEEEARSIATLQQFFVFCRTKSAEEALERIPEFFRDHYPEGS